MEAVSETVDAGGRTCFHLEDVLLTLSDVLLHCVLLDTGPTGSVPAYHHPDRESNDTLFVLIGSL